MAQRHREIAFAIVIDKQGHLLLQQRDDIPGIIAPGKIGFFGGHREGDETFLQCVVRELHEETSIHLPADRFEHFKIYRGPDLEVSGGTMNAEGFIVRDVRVSEVSVTEGSLFIAKCEEIPALMPRITSLAQIALRDFLGGDHTSGR
jgi:8-oxo-dGTP pyrophosphatase MutT (NUDIX family)